MTQARGSECGTCRGNDRRPFAPRGSWNFQQTRRLSPPDIRWFATGNESATARDRSNSVTQTTINSGGEFDAVSAFVLRCVKGCIGISEYLIEIRGAPSLKSRNSETGRGPHRCSAEGERFSLKP